MKAYYEAADKVSAIFFTTLNSYIFFVFACVIILLNFNWRIFNLFIAGLNDVLAKHDKRHYATKLTEDKVSNKLFYELNSTCHCEFVDVYFVKYSAT